MSSTKSICANAQMQKLEIGMLDMIVGTRSSEFQDTFCLSLGNHQNPFKVPNDRNGKVHQLLVDNGFLRVLCSAWHGSYFPFASLFIPFLPSPRLIDVCPSLILLCCSLSDGMKVRFQLPSRVLHNSLLLQNGGVST